MATPSDVSDARKLMSEFASRTGLSTAASAPQRYLWTDAFAVCSFLSLFDATKEPAYLDLARRLVDQVHETLGRHRPDDDRVGWISGLDEESGRRHPTAGGLRIGKPLMERSVRQPLNEREEWDRDGQYFHYLTKWMYALSRVAVVTADSEYCRYAIELARAAHAAFVYEAPGGGARRMHWKMSIDLSRALVPSMGHHDPLDALVTYRVLEHCRSAHFANAGLPDLHHEIDDVARSCAGRDWMTDDPLGIGGLLVDAYRIALLQRRGAAIAGSSPDRLLTDARVGLTRFARVYPLQASAESRLAFRELGLAIGLHALEAMRQQQISGEISLAIRAGSEMETLMGLAAIAREIESFWRRPDNQRASTWCEHLDINSVMLATSLLPGQFLA